jgi:hypothetical protein
MNPCFVKGRSAEFNRAPDNLDVMEEKISPAYARREYEVVIDERTWTIVPEETAPSRRGADRALRPRG